MIDRPKGGVEKKGGISVAGFGQFNSSFFFPRGLGVLRRFAFCSCVSV
jgi:hypothetical protein